MSWHVRVSSYTNQLYLLKVKRLLKLHVQKAASWCAASLQKIQLKKYRLPKFSRLIELIFRTCTYVLRKSENYLEIKWLYNTYLIILVLNHIKYIRAHNYIVLRWPDKKECIQRIIFREFYYRQSGVTSSRVLLILYAYIFTYIYYIKTVSNDMWHYMEDKPRTICSKLHIFYDIVFNHDFILKLFSYYFSLIERIFHSYTFSEYKMEYRPSKLLTRNMESTSAKTQKMSIIHRSQSVENISCDTLGTNINENKLEQCQTHIANNDRCIEMSTSISNKEDQLVRNDRRIRKAVIRYGTGSHGVIIKFRVNMNLASLFRLIRIKLDISSSQAIYAFYNGITLTTDHLLSDHVVLDIVSDNLFGSDKPESDLNAESEDRCIINGVGSEDMEVSSEGEGICTIGGVRDEYDRGSDRVNNINRISREEMEMDCDSELESSKDGEHDGNDRGSEWVDTLIRLGDEEMEVERDRVIDSDRVDDIGDSDTDGAWSDEKVKTKVVTCVYSNTRGSSREKLEYIKCETRMDRDFMGTELNMKEHDVYRLTNVLGKWARIISGDSYTYIKGKRVPPGGGE